MQFRTEYVIERSRHITSQGQGVIHTRNSMTHPTSSPKIYPVQPNSTKIRHFLELFYQMNPSSNIHCSNYLGKREEGRWESHQIRCLLLGRRGFGNF